MDLPLVQRYSRGRWLALAAAALGLFIVSVLLHNLIYGLFEVEEPFFFILATIVSPLAFIGSLIAAALAHPAQPGEEGRRSWWSFGPPRGPVGRLALGLLVACGVGFVLFFGGIAFGQSGGDTFFSNPYLALTILFTGACAVLAGVAAAVSVVRERERSLGAFMTIVFGIFVAFFAIGEAGGHDEPGSSPQPTRTPVSQSNSHTNLAVSPVSAYEVRVTFDYGYHHDPAEANITMITVTAFGPSGEPLAGYPVMRVPETGELQMGAGRVDMVLLFPEALLGSLNGFEVCFAAPGHPDLGCSTVLYTPR